GVNGLAFVHFDESDVVRHHLVQRIIRAYDEHKTRLAEQQLPLLEPKPVAPPAAPDEPRLRN
ncbi:MAG: PhoH family protein, partial [Terriglobales bacterium]